MDTDRVKDQKTEIAVFGGGCFWCTEAVFSMIRGVVEVIPAYTGGSIANPTYAMVSTGTTGHVEVVSIKYDPQLVPYRLLLTIFFASHDPTTLNRQGNDFGTQYRSVIFYTTDEQKKEAEVCIREINTSNTKGDRVVTTVEPLTVLYPAEDYHKEYFRYHTDAPYCQLVINPKLEKITREFAQFLNIQQ